MKKKLVVFLSFILVMAASIGFVRATSVLTLTATPSSALYDRYTAVSLNGTVDFYNYINHQPASDSLVGIELDDSTGAPMVVRTIQPGASQPSNVSALILSAYLSDSSGNQQTSVPLPTLDNEANPYFDVTVQNNLGVILPVLVTLNVFDSNGVPITVDSQPLSIGSYSTGNLITNFLIPSFAHYGNAYAYANVYTNWPSKGGVPLRPEKSFQFTITGGAAFTGFVPTSYGFGGFYNYTFTLPHDCALGTYTEYTTANYQSLYGAATTTFTVAQLGDLNGDHVVNFHDITIFVSAYIAYFQSGTYNAAIDYNHDGQINFKDLILFVQYYLVYWSS